MKNDTKRPKKDITEDPLVMKYCNNLINEALEGLERAKADMADSPKIWYNGRWMDYPEFAKYFVEYMEKKELK